VSVSPESTLFSSAIAHAGYSAYYWITASEESQQPMVAQQAYGRLKAIADIIPDRTATYQQVLLAAAEIGIRFAVDDLEYLRRSLEAAMSLEPAEIPTRQQLAAWLYALKTFEPNSNDFRRELLAIFAGHRGSIQIAENGISALMKRNKSAKPSETAQARLDLAEAALQPNLEKIEPAYRVAWLYRKADALGDLGNAKEALAILEPLEAEQPNDAGIKLRIARMLTAQQADPAKPLGKWRQLAAQLKPQSEGWFEAKYHVALLLVRSGEKEEARKMLEYMKAIPPGWENSHLRTEFDQLLQRLR
jgi:hypothetical protein